MFVSINNSSIFFVFREDEDEFQLELHAVSVNCKFQCLLLPFSRLWHFKKGGKRDRLPVWKAIDTYKPIAESCEKKYL